MEKREQPSEQCNAMVARQLAARLAQCDVEVVVRWGNQEVSGG